MAFPTGKVIRWPRGALLMAIYTYIHTYVWWNNEDAICVHAYAYTYTFVCVCVCVCITFSRGHTSEKRGMPVLGMQ
jgi:hypothetical protein